MADRARYDSNLIPSLIAVSNADGVTPVSVWADPSTHGLISSATLGGTVVPASGLTSAAAVQIVDGSGNQITSFGGGTQYTDGGIPPTHPVAPTLEFNNAGAWVTVGSANPLPVTGAGGGTVTQGTAAAVTAGWPVIGGELADTTGTFTNATQTTSVTSNSFDGYSTVIVSISGTYGTATGVFEISDDGGTTWYSVNAARTDGSAVETGYTTLTNTNRMWTLSVSGADEFRVRSTAVASGTVNVRLSIESMPTPEAASVSAYQATAANFNATVVGTGTFAVQAVLGAETTKVIGVTRTADGSGNLLTSTTNALDVNLKSGALLAGTNAIGTINLSPTASGGWTPYFANAITTTVAPTAAAGKFGGYMLINLNSTPAYLQVFDTTGAVTLGSTAPTFVIPIPANATAANGLAANVELANGIVIANGIKCAATTTSNGASTVATGLTGTLWVK